MVKIFTAVLTLLVLTGRAQDGVVQLVFTSDVHYGIYRHHFRGSDSVPSTQVNQAMVAAIDGLPALRIPGDSGVGGGMTVGHIDGLLITGDIANRQEKGIQAAAVSWQEFRRDYGALTTRTATGKATPLYVVAGNHDVSDALGYYRTMVPERDATSMAGIYNLMTGSDSRKNENYNYERDKPHFSRELAGVHLLFINLWPDAEERAWMEEDLKALPKGEPVLLFMHSPPDVDGRFFTNPNEGHTINEKDRFENLLPELFADGQSANQPSTLEQRELVVFLKAHPCIRAIFHGHENFTEFYDWHGPDNDISIPCFRVDSPMKGKLSSKDENRLSFQLLSFDGRTKMLTVRECLWNVHAAQGIGWVWGTSRSISLR